jgi:hypothetical protein
LAPWLNDEVVNEAWPLARVADPSTVVPSRNCTVPVAEAGVTVAVNVIADPTGAGFKEEESATDVFALTTCESAAE